MESLIFQLNKKYDAITLPLGWKTNFILGTDGDRKCVSVYLFSDIGIKFYCFLFDETYEACFKRLEDIDEKYLKQSIEYKPIKYSRFS